MRLALLARFACVLGVPTSSLLEDEPESLAVEIHVEAPGAFAAELRQGDDLGDLEVAWAAEFPELV